MSKDDGFTRIGVQFNERQITRLRSISARLGIPQSRLMCAVADVLTDEEIESIMSRYALVKAKEGADRVKMNLRGKIYL